MLSSDKILLMVIYEFSSFLICTVFQQQLKRMFELLFAKLMVYKAKLMKHFSLKMEAQNMLFIVACKKLGDIFVQCKVK